MHTRLSLPVPNHCLSERPHKKVSRESSRCLLATALAGSVSLSIGLSIGLSLALLSVSAVPHFSLFYLLTSVYFRPVRMADNERLDSKCLLP